jgi:hypothetical protein
MCCSRHQRHVPVRRSTRQGLILMLAPAVVVARHLAREEREPGAGYAGRCHRGGWRHTGGLDSVACGSAGPDKDARRGDAAHREVELAAVLDQSNARVRSPPSRCPR